MRKSGIPYLDMCYNAAVGCTAGCSYCWARRSAARQAGRSFGGCSACATFAPHWHNDVDPPSSVKKPAVVGVSFMGELFDPDRSPFEIRDVLTACVQALQHTHVFLTRRPREWEHWRQYADGGENWWLGTTVTGNPANLDTLLNLGISGPHLWVSLEPLFSDPLLHDLPVSGYEWAVIGCDNGVRGTPAAGRDWNAMVADLVKALHKGGVQVYVKQVVNPKTGRCTRDVAEWPPELRVQEMPWTLRTKGKKP